MIWIDKFWKLFTLCHLGDGQRFFRRNKVVREYRCWVRDCSWSQDNWSLEDSSFLQSEVLIILTNVTLKLEFRIYWPKINHLKVFHSYLKIVGVHPVDGSLPVSSWLDDHPKYFMKFSIKLWILSPGDLWWCGVVDSANVAPWLPLPQETVDKRTLPRLPVLMLRSAHSPVKNIKDLPLSCFTWILCYGRKHGDFCQESTECPKRNASIAAGYWRPFIGAPCRFRFLDTIHFKCMW